jgi:hypothetical protein
VSAYVSSTSSVAVEPSAPNTPISTAGGGSAHWKIEGDHNVITTEGGRSCMFEVYGTNNTISFQGGGSNVVNILEGPTTQSTSAPAADATRSTSRTTP